MWIDSLLAYRYVTTVLFYVRLKPTVMMMPTVDCFKEYGFVRFAKRRVWEIVTVEIGRDIDILRGEVEIML